MVRSDLITLLAEENYKLSREDIESAVRMFFDKISVHLAKGGRVELRGFGSFSTRGRTSRTARDPRNGAPVEVQSRRHAHFKPGKEMQIRLNPRTS